MDDVLAFLIVAGVHAAVVFLFLFWVMPRFFRWLLGLEDSIRQSEERIRQEIDEDGFTDRVWGFWAHALLHSVYEQLERDGGDDSDHRHEDVILED